MRRWIPSGWGWVKRNPLPVGAVLVGVIAVAAIGFSLQSESAVLWSGLVVGVIVGAAIAAATGKNQSASPPRRPPKKPRR